MDLHQGEKPLISAIITTLNRPDLLMRAIRSVLTQTYAQLELIIVVDGPCGATVDRLGSFTDPRVRTVVLPENVGVAEARNLGVHESRGEWVAFLDDDDEWLPEKIEIQLKAVSVGIKSANLVVSRFEERSLDGIRIRPKTFPAPGGTLERGLLLPKGTSNSVYVLCKEIFDVGVAFQKRITQKRGCRLVVARTNVGSPCASLGRRSVDSVPL